VEREGVGWWIFLGFDLKSGCRDSGRFLMLVLDWILMLDLKSGCRDSGLDSYVGSEEWVSGFWTLDSYVGPEEWVSGFWTLDSYVGSEEWVSGFWTLDSQCWI